MAKKGKPVEGGSVPDKIEAHCLKSPAFRTIHVDGVWGGLTPTGYIAATFWSQRLAIPKVIEYKVGKNDGSLTEIERKGLSGIVRELEVNAVFDVNFAVSLRDWLDSKIKEHRQAIASQAPRTPGVQIQ